MDELCFIKIEQSSSNYHKIKKNNRYIKINIDSILCPFGIDEEYGNSVIKFEIDQTNTKHLEVINQIRLLENKLKEQFNSNEDEWKSLINLRDNNNIFLEARIKKIKNNILTKLTFDDKDNNYLKTLYELGKNFNCNIILEIPTLWDFRKNNEKNNSNKIGLILNLFSIHVY